MRTFYGMLTQRHYRRWLEEQRVKYPDFDWPFVKAPFRVRLRRACRHQWLALRETVGRWIYPYPIEDE